MAFATYPSLANRVVFISGGGSGIGAAMVEAFAGSGARVAFVDILADASAKLAERLAGSRHKPYFIRCDLLDIAALQTAIADVRRDFGPIGVLVNNAANDDRRTVEDISPEYWDHTFDVNLRHQFFAAQAVRPQMQELGGGSIINFSSTAWMAGVVNLVAYATAKSAVIGLTNGLARTFGADNIRVNAIAPGAVITERQLRLWYDESQADKFAEMQMLHRRLLPEEIARTALFLASDDSRMITKQCIVVDAGLR